MVEHDIHQSVSATPRNVVSGHQGAPLKHDEKRETSVPTETIPIGSVGVMYLLIITSTGGKKRERGQARGPRLLPRTAPEIPRLTARSPPPPIVAA